MGVLTRDAGIGAFAERRLGDADFATIARMAHAHAGIVLTEGKRTLVSSRLARLAREHDDGSFESYVRLIVRDADARRQAIEALTTNHTKFFREDHHFHHVARVLRPMVLAAVAARQRVRLWSAGSSSGEEVYSLAMTLLGSDRNEARTILNGDVAILASDINARVLETGRAGLYAASARDEMPAELAKLWTAVRGDRLEIRPELRAMVRFRQLNLLNDWPMSGQFDAIFCRNTMIYFDADTSGELQCRMADRLKPRGFYYIGHSERLQGRADTLFEPVGQTIFRKVAT